MADIVLFSYPPNRTGSVHVLRGGVSFFFSFLTGRVPFADGEGKKAFPLYVRDVGMSYATAVTWLFSKFWTPTGFEQYSPSLTLLFLADFIVALTFPRLLTAFKPQGAFGWYAGCE